MQSEIVRKLNAEMVLDIESERQVVYILAQIRKLIELGSFAKGEWRTRSLRVRLGTPYKP